MNISYHLPSELPKGMLSINEKINLKAMKRLHKRKVDYSRLEHGTLENSLSFLGLSFLISKMKDLEKLFPKVLVGSKSLRLYPVSSNWCFLHSCSHNTPAIVTLLKLVWSVSHLSSEPSISP